MRKGCAALGLLLLAAGCGDGGPTLVPVHGRVTLDGKPLAGKSVRFHPDPGTPGSGAGANTDADGNYTLLAIRPGATRDMPGVPAGAYRVVVTEPMFPIDLPVQKADDPEPVPAIGRPADIPRKRQAIPSIYGNPDTTPLRVEVPKNGGPIDLQLRTPSDAKK
jgi:hypothetical protein